MRIDYACTLVAVLIGCISLKLQHKQITPASVCDTLGTKTANRRTVERAMDDLEKRGVLRRFGGKQGKPYKYIIYPRKLPTFIWETAAGKATLWRIGEKAERKGLARHADDDLVINAKPMMEDPNFMTAVRAIVKAVNKEAVVTDEKVTAILDGKKLELDTNFLSWFQNTVCSREVY